MKKQSAKGGFTLVELMMTIVVIAIMVGILIPAVMKVRQFAQKAKQKTYMTTIEMSLEMFKNDVGNYPESSNDVGDYGGAQKLAEAMMGWDLFGFNPRSEWVSNPDLTAGTGVYFSNNIDLTDAANKQNLSERVGPYLDPSDTPCYLTDNLYTSGSASTNTYVITDNFPIRKARALLRSSQFTETQVNMGMPILYYRANTSKKEQNTSSPTGGNTENNIYNFNDNYIYHQSSVVYNTDKINGTHFSDGSYSEAQVFDRFIKDENKSSIYTTGTSSWPLRSDSFILISAGPDHLYGTSDDITNFK